MKTIYCVACEDETSGGTWWWPTIAEAQAYFDERTNPTVEGGYVTLYAVEVDDAATKDEITEACDHAMWECDDAYRNPIKRVNLIPPGAKYGPTFLQSAAPGASA